MKKYMQPTATVIEFSVEDALLSSSTLSTYDKVGDEGEYSRKKGGWGSELWADTEEE